MNIAELIAQLAALDPAMPVEVEQGARSVPAGRVITLKARADQPAVAMLTTATFGR